MQLSEAQQEEPRPAETATSERPVHRRPGATLYRYIILEMAFPTLYTLGGLTLVVMTKELIGFSELVINRGLSVADVGALALYQMLPVLSSMLPFAVLVGGLVALGRLGADRELLMLEASGISSPRILGPMVVFSAGMTLLAIMLSAQTSPWASRSLDEKLDEIGRRNPSAAITPGKVHRFGSWMLQATEVSASGDEMRGVFLWMPSVGETVFARSGRLEKRGAVHDVVLEDGSVLLDPRKGARELRFAEMKAELPSSGRLTSRGSKDKLQSLDLSELLVEAQNQNIRHRDRIDAGLELHRRFSLPASTVVFGLLIVPIFLSRAHFSRSGGGVMGLVLTLGYYGLAQLADGFAYDGSLALWQAAWLPNFVLLAIAGLMILRMTRMSSFGRDSDRPPSAEPKQKKKKEAVKGAVRAVRLRARPRPLERYVAVRFLQIAGLCFSVVLVGYLLIDILERLQWMGKYGATFGQVMSYYGARVPMLASRVVPMSLLVATALTVSFLASQGELMGMRSNGIPAPRALMPILVICAAIAPLYFLLNNEVLPRTNALASYFKAEVKGKNKKAVRPGGLGAWFVKGDRFFQAERLDPKEGTATNITVYTLDKSRIPIARGDAVSAVHIGDGQWLLEDAVRVERTEEGLRQAESPAFAKIGEAIQADVDTKHLSVGELQEAIEEVEASGLDSTHYRVDLFVKLAAPVACVVLPALALFFAVGGPPHPSSQTTLVVSAVVAVSYVLLTGVGTSLGYGGTLPAWLAGAAPTLFFGAIAAYFGLRLRGFGEALRR